MSSSPFSLARLRQDVVVSEEEDLALPLKEEAKRPPKGEVAVEVAPPNESLQVGGRLAHFRRHWTFSPWAFSVVSNGLG